MPRNKFNRNYNKTSKVEHYHFYPQYSYQNYMPRAMGNGWFCVLSPNNEEFYYHTSWLINKMSYQALYNMPPLNRNEVNRGYKTTPFWNQPLANNPPSTNNPFQTNKPFLANNPPSTNNPFQTKTTPSTNNSLFNNDSKFNHHVNLSTPTQKNKETKPLFAFTPPQTIKPILSFKPPENDLFGSSQYSLFNPTKVDSEGSKDVTPITQVDSEDSKDEETTPVDKPIISVKTHGLNLPPPIKIDTINTIADNNIKLEINRVNTPENTPENTLENVYGAKDIETGNICDLDNSPELVDWMSIDQFSDENWVAIEEDSSKVDSHYEVGRHYEVLYNDYWYYCKIDKKVDDNTYDILYKQYDPSIPSLTCNNRLPDSMVKKVERGVNVDRIRQLSDFKELKKNNITIQVLNYTKGFSDKPVEWLDAKIDEISDPDEPDVIYDNGNMEENVNSYRIRFYN